MRTPAHCRAWIAFVALAFAACDARAEAVAASEVDRLASMSLEDLLRTEVTSLAGTAAPRFGTPAAMTVITAEDIRRAGHRSLPEALRMVPGMFVGRIDAGAWTVGSRGLTGSRVTANRYLVLIDGRLVYDPLTSATMWDAVDLPLGDVDRVEVVRGPGPTLWGVNAMNGVVNVITRDARDTLGTRVDLLAGTGGAAQAYLRHGTTATADSAVRMWAAYARQGEFEDAAGNGNGDAWSRIRVGLRWDGAIGDGLGYTVAAGAYDHPHARARVRLPVPGLHDTFEVVAEDRTVRGAHARFHVGHAPTSKEGWSLHGSADRNDRTSTRLAVERTTTDLEYRRWRPWGDGQLLIWGASWTRTRDDTTPGPVLQFEPRGRAWSTLNVFAQNTSELVPDTAWLMVGTKLTDHEFVGLQWQPSVRAWWTPSASQTLWAAVSRPVRVPSRLEEDGLLVFSYVDEGLLATGTPNGVIVPVGIGGDDTLPAEALVSYEVGHRIRFSPRFALDTTLFYNDYRQLVGVPPGIVGRFNDDASGATWGGDVVATARWTGRWRMEASYSRLHTRIEGPVLRFDEIGTPRQLAQLRSYVDVRDDFEFNAAAYYVDPVPFAGAPAYTRLDLGVAWRPAEGIELSLWGQNLLDDGHPEGSDVRVPRGIYAQLTVHGGE